MIRKVLSVAWLLLISLSLSFAQESDPHKLKYDEGRSFFMNGQYGLAMEVLKNVVQSADNTPYKPYASFYYAVAAYREGYFELAKNMFLQIKNNHAGWSQMAEVNFWLGDLYFQKLQYNQALNALKNIKRKNFEESIQTLKYYYLNKIDTVALLQTIYENHPDDEIIAQVLAEKIAHQPLVNQDQELLNSLIDEFDLDRENLNVVQIEKTVFKDKYRVAALFPFVVDRLEPNDKRKVNQFVLDVYQGMVLALDTLNSGKIKIDLFAYDTKRDSISTAQVLQNEELKTMDLIVGPIFTQPAKMINEFAYQHHINTVYPLSSNSDLIGKNPYSFLFNPSDETVGRKTADYVAGKVKNKYGMIFYGTSRNDSALAFAYKERIERDSFEIVLTKKIQKDSSRSILDMLLISDTRLRDASTEEAKEKYGIAMDSVGHIFVASSNDLISSKVISAVETRGDSIVVVGSADWLELPIINFEVYKRLGTVLYAPLYTDRSSEAYQTFRAKYISRHKKAPTKYVEIGYDLMMCFGKSLQQYGKYFQLAWNEKGFLPGYLSMGYDYQNTNDNQVVPILNFTKDNMQIILEKDEDSDDEHTKK